MLCRTRAFVSITLSFLNNDVLTPGKKLFLVWPPPPPDEHRICPLLILPCPKRSALKCLNKIHTVRGEGEDERKRCHRACRGSRWQSWTEVSCPPFSLWRVASNVNVRCHDVGKCFQIITGCKKDLVKSFDDKCSNLILIFSAKEL